MSGEVFDGRFASGFTRLLRDQAVVEGNLPAATEYLQVEGVAGWRYPVVSALGDRFLLFLYFDGSAYQVLVAAPDVAREGGSHRCHLFPDGRICLGRDPSGGLPTLQAAYAKSVVWANGYSVYLRTSQFPF